VSRLQDHIACLQRKLAVADATQQRLNEVAQCGSALTFSLNNNNNNNNNNTNNNKTTIHKAQQHG